MSAPHAGEWVVECDGLTRRFAEFTAVDNLTLRVARGTIFGFLGPSGCGKTTTIRMLCGLLKATSGRAVVQGFDINREAEALRQHLGYMSQKFSLYPDMTVRENLKFYGGVYGMRAARRAERMEELLARLEMTRQADTLTAALPMGWKQRAALAAALLHEPPVLFLDEPTSGVDPASRRLFWEMLDDLAASGTSIFVTTHAMDEVERCDQVGIMDGGRLVASDSPAGLKRGFQGRLFHVEAEPLIAALDAARALPGAEEASLFGTALHVTARDLDAETIRRQLEGAGITVHDVYPIAPTLEDVFVQLVLQHERSGATAAGSRA